MGFFHVRCYTVTYHAISIDVQMILNEREPTEKDRESDMCEYVFHLYVLRMHCRCEIFL